MTLICSKIVVPYDHSPLSKKALHTAMNIANNDNRIKLDVVTVLDITMPASYYTALNAEEEYEAQRAEARGLLNQAKQEIINSFPNMFETHLLEGNPAEMIIEFVNHHHTDLVVMGSRGLSGVKEMILGSVSHHVVQKSPCPVFIVK